MKRTKDYLLFRPRQAFMALYFFFAPADAFGQGEAILHGRVADEKNCPIASNKRLGATIFPDKLKFQIEIEDNYLQIKEEVMAIIESEMKGIYDSPELAHLLVAREE